MPDGTEQALDMHRLADRYIRPGWVQTVHAAQGATATRVLAHGELPPHRPRQSLYVALSRARDTSFLYTDDRDSLTAAITQRSGNQAAALDQEPNHDWGAEFG